MWIIFLVANTAGSSTGRLDVNLLVVLRYTLGSMFPKQWCYAGLQAVDLLAFKAASSLPALKSSNWPPSNLSTGSPLCNSGSTNWDFVICNGSVADGLNFTGSNMTGMRS